MVLTRGTSGDMSYICARSSRLWLQFIWDRQTDRRTDRQLLKSAVTTLLCRGQIHSAWHCTCLYVWPLSGQTCHKKSSKLYFLYNHWVITHFVYELCVASDLGLELLPLQITLPLPVMLFVRGTIFLPTVELFKDLTLYSKPVGYMTDGRRQWAASLIIHHHCHSFIKITNKTLLIKCESINQWVKQNNSATSRNPIKDAEICMNIRSTLLCVCCWNCRVWAIIGAMWPATIVLSSTISDNNQHQFVVLHLSSVSLLY